ncbi:MAG TPA: hypothetical protein VFR46_00785 [Actinomycetes bacterium]|nr:hypothetical protein [Actinomycetes bacterium]
MRARTSVARLGPPRRRTLNPGVAAGVADTTSQRSWELLQTRPAEATQPDGFGQLPALAVTTAVGLLVVALADTLARAAHGAAVLVFWAGLLIMFVPLAGRLVGASASRTERIGLVLIAGVGFYLVKLAQSPIRFSFFDEFLHTRTAEDIIRAGRLFTPSSMVPVSPFYPGLEGATTSLMSLGDFSTFEAGTIVLAVARVMLVLALFLLFESAGGSPRVAGVAALVYMLNPNFMFFSAQFAYESLALPFAVMTIYAISRRGRTADRPYVAWLVILPLAAATVITHHVTSLALTAFLVVWTVVHLLGRLRAGDGNGSDAHVLKRLRNAPFTIVSPVKPTLVVAAMAVGWLLLVATVTVGYLGPAIEGAASEVIRLALGEAGPRQLFRGAGQGPPFWEVALGYASVVLILVALPIGVIQLFRHGRLNSVQLSLALAAQAYPAAQVARFTERGAEISARTTTFVFLAVAFVVAVAIVAAQPVRFGRIVRFAVPVALVTVIFAGGVVIGVPVWARLPGPYLVGADQRSIEPESIASAEWTKANLGPNNRFLADRSNRLLLGTIGQQHMVTGAGDRVNLRPVFFAPELGAEEVASLKVGRVKYVLVDRRLSSALPLVGVYTERGESRGGRLTEPIDPAALGKYDVEPGVSRLYDSGNIQIYDVSGF